MRKNEKGFGVIEVLLIIGVVAVIGLLGWTFWNANNGNSSISDQKAVQAPAVKSSEDLNTADKALDATDVVGTDSQQLDAQTNF